MSDFETQLLGAGGVPTLITMLTIHKTNQPICESVSGVFAKLSETQNGRDETIKALPALVQAYVAHPDSKTLFELITMIVENVSKTKTGETACINAGAVEALVTGVSLHGSI
jgi:hypothetical protein